MKQADILVLFGGTILCGGDILAKAIQKNVAKKYIIVGGAGHTTDTLRNIIHGEFADIDTKDKPEAEILNAYIKRKYGVEADYLETESTNCGNNITYLLDLVKEEGMECNNIILCQDATMQMRMFAGMRKFCSPNVCVINYATYQAIVEECENELTFSSQIHGMWSVEKYINLLMGEIPRLTDNEDGYGPKGKDFIAHVDIPEEVERAFLSLRNTYDIGVREANPLYASK